MGTVAALMRPPGDPFHERLVACYPQIRRFLPRLLDALDFEAIDPARPVLDAYHALGDWLDEQAPHHPPARRRGPPGGDHRRRGEPHVHDREDGTVDRAGYACCVLDQLRTRLRRRDIYAPGSTRWGDPRAELLTPGDWDRPARHAV